jgi:hypothetical protein
METLRTSNIEGAIMELSRQHYRTLVRCDCRLHKPIRVRAKLLGDANAYIVKWNTGDSQIDAWHRNGGVLLDYVSPRLTDVRPLHEAQVLVECPMSIARIHAATKRTTAVTVIYKPPSWAGHRERALDRFPTVELCQKFWSMVQEAGERLSDDLARGDLSLRTDQFNCVRRTVFDGACFDSVVKVRLRTAPSPGILLDVYQAIGKLPEEDGVYLLEDGALKASAKFWKAQMRILRKRGHVLIVDTLSTYRMPPKLPNWGRIAKACAQAQHEVDALIEYVEAMPVIPLSADAPAARIQSHAPAPI